MGGKQKQRTKGNVRPSSSARAAELLESGGNAIGFVGFGAMSDLGYVPATHGGDDVDVSIDADFRMVLRKFSKRDSITKIKALQEFTSLCKDKEEDAVKTVLPFWPRLYNKIAIDHDRRVREAVQNAFNQLVLRVHRNLAPHLKSLMGCWLASQCDVYAPAASAAKAAFQNAFPPAKQTEALTYCKDEILAHILDHLFVQSALTLSDPKTTEKEDMESKYEKVLTSNLGALKLFVTAVPQASQESLHDKYREILAGAKFWKMGKNKVNTIRSAFYMVLSAFCQVHPSLMKEQSAKISPIVLHNLNETDPLVSFALWEAVLYTVTVIDDCWTQISPRKGMLPQLWSMLREGGNGSANIIYPSLLPLLSKMPEAIIGDGLGFYELFFGNLKTGLSVEKVQLSSSESNAVAKAFFECAQYLLTHNLDSTNSNLCHYLISEQILPVFEASLVEPAHSLSVAIHPPFVHLLSSMMHLSGTCQTAQVLFDELWIGFRELCISRVSDGNQQVLSRLGSLFICLKEGHSVQERKSAKVHFSEARVEDSQALPTKQVTVTNPKLASLASSRLVLDTVCDVCKSAYDLACQKDSKAVAYLRLYAQLCQGYMSETMLTLLSEEGGSEGFIKNTVLATMKDWEGRDGLKSVAVELVTILMAVVDIVSSEQKIVLLQMVFMQVDNSVLLYALLQRLVSTTDRPVRQWLLGPVVGEKLVHMVEQLCEQSMDVGQQPKSEQWSLLALVLSQQDMLLGPDYTERLLSHIHAALPTPAACSNQSDINTSISFVCDVAHQFFSGYKDCLLLKAAEDLLLALFQISCHGNHNLPCLLVEKIESTWQLGIKAISFQKGALLTEDGFLKQALMYMRNLVLCETDTMIRLEMLIHTALCFGECIASAIATDGDSLGLLDPTVQQLFKECLLLRFDHTATSEWSVHAVLQRDLFVDDYPLTMATNTPTDSIPKCLAAAAFTSRLFVAMATTAATTEEDKMTKVEVLMQESGGQQVALDLVFAGALAKVLLADSGQTCELSKVTTYLLQQLQQLLKVVGKSQTQQILQTLLDTALQDGYLSALAIGQFLGQVKDRSFELLAMFGGMDKFSSLDVPAVHSLCQLLPFLSNDDVSLVLQLQAAQIISCPHAAILQVGLPHLYVYNQCVAYGTPSAEIGVGVLAAVHQWRQESADDELFAFDSDITKLPWLVVALNVESMYIMSHMLDKLADSLKDVHWDFILCSLASWLQSTNETASTTSISAQHFTRAACNLLVSAATALQGNQVPESMLDDWREFFCPTVYGTVLPLFTKMAVAKPLPASIPLLTAVSQAASTTPLSLLLANESLLPPRLVSEDESETLTPSLLSFLNTMCPLLAHCQAVVRRAACTLLNRLMPEICKQDEAELSKATCKDDNTRCPPRALMTILNTSSQVLDLIVHDVPVGECVVIEPGTDEYTYSSAYLLSWQLLIGLFKAASPELRAQYNESLRERVGELLDNLFRLMPSAPSTESMFTQPPLEGADCQELQWWACHVYYGCLRDVPAILRQWWVSLDKKTASIVDRFTSKFVSSLLCGEEINAVNTADTSSLDNMTVRARPVAREVVAAYSVDEVCMELVVRLPSNHPLGVVSVESGRRVGVATDKWRKWMLQLTTYLTHQNGSILDGLLLWKRNVDKRFEGVDDCMICYSVIHCPTYQLPRLQCKTCKKRFHSPCLYKWFNTSNNSSCPLCRNLF